MKNLKNIKLLIIMLSIIIIGIIGTIIVLKNIIKNNNETNQVINIAGNSNETNQNINITENSNKDDHGKNNVIEEDDTKIVYDAELKKVTSESTLYNINKNINNYYTYIKESNTQAIEELGGNNLYTLGRTIKYILKEAYITENEFQNRYYTKGTLISANGDLTATEQEAYILLYIDLENGTYKIENIDIDKYMSIESLNKASNIDIPRGSYNTYKYDNISEAKQIELYLENYSFYIFNYTEKAYNLLDSEYSTKRFGNYNKFFEYLVNKRLQLQKIELDQYNIREDDDGNIRYRCVDKYGNYYEIIVTDYMEYTIKLDNYTIQDGYEDLSEEDKVGNNAEKFISMINSNDYTNAYNLLETEFKEANFPTEQSFIDYLKQNFFENNIIVTKSVTGNVCTIMIKETLSTQSNRFQKQFKITLGEDENFTISFNI